MALLVSDLEELGQTALAEFAQNLAQAKQADATGVERQIQRLEAKLEQLYAVAATMARREETLEGIASIWGRMVSICDDMAGAVSNRCSEPPTRSTGYDRILDIRNACEENRLLHT